MSQKVGFRARPVLLSHGEDVQGKSARRHHELVQLRKVQEHGGVRNDSDFRCSVSHQEHVVTDKQSPRSRTSGQEVSDAERIVTVRQLYVTALGPISPLPLAVGQQKACHKKRAAIMRKWMIKKY